jgi:Mrp family chromosome partitioning ATPase
MRAVCDVVILDSAPLLAASDTVLISGVVEATLIVNRVGEVTRDQLNESKNLLDVAKANLLGAVVVGSERRGRHYGYYYRQY